MPGGGGGRGGHGPRAQALEGAPAQLVGANFKKKIRPRQISKVTSLQCWMNLVAKVAYVWARVLSRAQRSLCIRGFLLFLFSLKTFYFLFYFFCLSIFFPRAPPPLEPDAGFTKRGGGHPEPQRCQPCRPMWRGGGNSGGGGADASIGPPGAGDPRHTTVLGAGARQRLGGVGWI